MDAATFRGSARFLFLPLHATVLFGWSYVLAMVWRRNAPLHARFMIASGLILIDPVASRLLDHHAPPLSNPLHMQAITFGLIDAFLLAMLWRPRMAPRTRTRYALGASAFVLLQLAWFTVVQGPGWLPLAEWFRALPLT